MESGLRACQQEKCQLCSNTASQPFDKYFACIDWSCCTARCKYFIRNSLVVASIVDSNYQCFAITCHKSWLAFFWKYVTVRDYKGSPTEMHWLFVVRSTLHPAWAVLPNVHARVTYIGNIFEDLLNRLTRSGLRQWVAGVFVRAAKSREVEARTRHDKAKYSFKSITQSTQRCHVQPWDFHQRCSVSLFTIVMDVERMTQSVSISSLNIVNGTSAGQGTWWCSLPAIFFDREQMSVQELMALKRMPHKTLDGHLQNQLIFVWIDCLQ